MHGSLRIAPGSSPGQRSSCAPWSERALCRAPWLACIWATLVCSGAGAQQASYPVTTAPLALPPSLQLSNTTDRASGISPNLAQPTAVQPIGAAGVVTTARLKFREYCSLSFSSPIKPGPIRRHRVQLRRTDKQTRTIEQSRTIPRTVGSVIPTTNLPGRCCGAKQSATPRPARRHRPAARRRRKTRAAANPFGTSLLCRQRVKRAPTHDAIPTAEFVQSVGTSARILRPHRFDQRYRRSVDSRRSFEHEYFACGEIAAELGCHKCANKRRLARRKFRGSLEAGVRRQQFRSNRRWKRSWRR